MMTHDPFIAMLESGDGDAFDAAAQSSPELTLSFMVTILGNAMRECDAGRTEDARDAIAYAHEMAIGALKRSDERRRLKRQSAPAESRAALHRQQASAPARALVAATTDAGHGDDQPSRRRRATPK